ncbi:MAG: TonB-dependent receptor, partial [Campylobacterales bacterium]|nr:TonB-dependent receptor [Campylobacterales bacterium]
FDVEEFGNLSGSVKVQTKKPSKELSGEVYVNMGSFGYKKAGATIGGGNDTVQVMVTASKEESDQYEDGDGNTLVQQLANANTITAYSKNPELQNQYSDMKAFEKQTMMVKTNLNLTENQNLEVSYTINESDNILYANSKMDALYDDSNILNVKYEARDLSSFSKKLQFKAYTSDVEHPMSTKYRIASDINTTAGEDSLNEVISSLTTDVSGAKIINEMEVMNSLVTVGLDSSKRNWDGSYIGYGQNAGITGRKSIDDVDTTNNAIFMKAQHNYGKTTIELGARYNDSTISTAKPNYADRDFNSLDLNLVASYKTDSNAKYFVAIGKASRVPDARELYFNSSINVMSGTPTLDQTTNTEIDLGVQKSYENGMVKAKAFYSSLDNYIYFNKGNTLTNAMGISAYNSFENIDATIYGIELSSEYDMTENLFMDFSAAYTRGKKDRALTSTNYAADGTTVISITQQTDKDLADITPLKANIGFNYIPDVTLKTRFEVVAAKSWDNYDADNGEQQLPGYAVVNMKAQKTFAKNFELTVGVDNVFDTTYAVSNTYADLKLLSNGTTGDVMLLNEPGRYIYTQLKYTF